MKIRSTLAAMSAAALALGLAACGGDGGGGGEGGDFPSGPIKVIAPADPGSGWDLTARAVAQDLTKSGIVSTPLPVENRPGAVGTVFLAQMVEQNKGDDDIIAVTSLAMMVNTALGQTDYSYEDVTMLASLAAEHYVVVAAADSEFEDLGDVVDAIKEDPGSVPVGAATDDQFPFSLIVHEGDGDASKINYVAYEGGGEQSTALLTGDIKVAVAGYSEFAPLLEAGEVSGLAIVAPEAVEGVDMPTAKEQGFDVTIENWRGLYGPPDMPQEAVDFWTDALTQLVETDEWAATLEKNQWSPLFMTGEEFDTYLADSQKQVNTGMELVSGGGR